MEDDLDKGLADSQGELDEMENFQGPTVDTQVLSNLTKNEKVQLRNKWNCRALNREVCMFKKQKWKLLKNQLKTDNEIFQAYNYLHSLQGKTVMNWSYLMGDIPLLNSLLLLLLQQPRPL